jgi:hypothetical protein
MGKLAATGGLFLFPYYRKKPALRFSHMGAIETRSQLTKRYAKGLQCQPAYRILHQSEVTTLKEFKMSILDRARNLQTPARDFLVPIIEDCLREMGKKHKKRPGLSAVCDMREVAQKMQNEIDFAPKS